MLQRIAKGPTPTLHGNEQFKLRGKVRCAACKQTSGNELLHLFKKHQSVKYRGCTKDRCSFLQSYVLTSCGLRCNYLTLNAASHLLMPNENEFSFQKLQMGSLGLHHADMEISKSKPSVSTSRTSDPSKWRRIASPLSTKMMELRRSSGNASGCSKSD